VLFFSNHGKVYRLKVWKLPEGAPQTKGRPMVNLLPLAEGEAISTVLPLPEDEDEWGALSVMFATARGGVRRNSMDSFTNVPSNGKFAMKFDDDSDDHLIGVELLTDSDDVLLATRNGKAIRFAGDAVRSFQSRTSTGVRGIALKGDDEVISLSVLRGFDASTKERDQYLKAAPWKDNENASELSAERMAEFEESEDFILTVCANGYGKRSSAFEYRQSGRGGQGILNIDNIERNGTVIASFEAKNEEQIMLVTDQAKLIRMKVADMRVIGRNSSGVRLFDVADGETVVGAAKIDEEDEAENEAEEAVNSELEATENPADNNDSSETPLEGSED
jgi:DNA gyrase subunit A